MHPSLHGSSINLMAQPSGTSQTIIQHVFVPCMIYNNTCMLLRIQTYPVMRYLLTTKTIPKYNGNPDLITATYWHCFLVANPSG